MREGERIILAIQSKRSDPRLEFCRKVFSILPNNVRILTRIKMHIVDLVVAASPNYLFAKPLCKASLVVDSTSRDSDVQAIRFYKSACKISHNKF